MRGPLDDQGALDGRWCDDEGHVTHVAYRPSHRRDYVDGKDWVRRGRYLGVVDDIVGRIERQL
jgi:hypothetical protein